MVQREDQNQIPGWASPAVLVGLQGAAGFPELLSGLWEVPIPFTDVA